MLNVASFLSDIPHWERYYTLDELHERSAEIATQYPDEVTLMDLGKSTNGETIDCLKVGNGKFNALIHGFPNSEEPYGGNMIDFLARRLAEDKEVREELDYTWYLIPCSDPDGARLCEGFQVGPHTPLNFSLNYYRTPTRITPEWCFPFRFGPLDLNSPTPETRALMKVIDRIELSFVSSLHMMKWDGVTFQIPHACPELYHKLQESARMFGIFPRKRPGTTLAPGISKAYYLTVARGYLRQWARGNTNIEPITGCYIYEYGQMLNPHLFMMIPECTLWYDPRMWDDTPTEEPLGDSLKIAQEIVSDTENFMLGVWKQALPHLHAETPFKAMIAEMMEPLISDYTNVSNPPLSFDAKVHARKATVSEKIGTEAREVAFRMTHIGGLYRVLDAELQQSGDETIDTLCSDVRRKLDEYDKRLHENYRVATNPIKNNVGMGIASILHSAVYAKERQP